MTAKKRWLEPYPWEVVVYLNVQACKTGDEKHNQCPEKSPKTQKLWEETRCKDLTLKEAIELCRECHRLAPFRFFNGNTFAAVARSMTEEISKQLSDMNIHIFRGVIEHYVAGTIEADEFDRVYQSVLKSLKAESKSA